MFLSRVPVNEMSRAFRRDYADVHDMHRTLMSVFGEAGVDAAARRHHGLLWRMDEVGVARVGEGTAARSLLVQSRVRPDWTRLPHGYASGRIKVTCLQPVLAAAVPGGRFAFRLVANPTRSTPPVGGAPGGRARGKRRPIHDPEEQVAWLIRQGERHGFVIPTASDGAPDAAAEPRPALVGRKVDQRSKARGDSRLKISILPAAFAGRLIVTDPGAFSEAVKEGIGRAKAYGCGLMGLEPDLSAVRRAS
ncbi:type I-E CRISPR-associated protein Cas6/Cse3/CasE [Nocardiopsis suaedae]|uniref:Type I-E CRISPR-associated protein Cas6/Cse3/CasE n=1 Tax=Nocardiopsis suaedae TaxID=3018444 RepID=A0ABT4TMR2_9ACTN|nr:type I-E CRISPR-associated protein Cas6/Cse3/CasE [Nocardiopsis suaedae]MDA2805534.1 type I-E CRISPR-associated protein Cas6/Cse3/CasE [Nocardiopsis suaedae]